MKRIYLILPISIGLGIGLTDVTWAASGTTFQGPVGATDLGNAYIPGKSGIYIGLTDVYAYANAAYDDARNSSRATAVANAFAAYFMYVYPFRVLGGTFASGVQPSYYSPTTAQLRADEPKMHNEGWGDLYVDLLNWSRYIGPMFGERSQHERGTPAPGLTLKAEYSMIFPISHFDPHRAANVGTGTYIFIPNFAATYLMAPGGAFGNVEYDLHVFYNRQTENWRNDYISGDVVDIDFTAGKKIGLWTFGATGSYAFQIQDDKIGPRHEIVLGNGRHYESLRVGPIVEVKIPALRALFKVKAQIPVVNRNTLGLTAILANLAFAL